MCVCVSSDVTHRVYTVHGVLSDAHRIAEDVRVIGAICVCVCVSSDVIHRVL